MNDIDPSRKNYPELVFGLVGPVGTDLDLVARSLEDALQCVRYRAFKIHLSRSMLGLVGEPWETLSDSDPYDVRLDRYMRAGNAFRERTEHDSALALMALIAIRVQRDESLREPRKAFIIRSLKREEEVRTLRRVYGPAFVLIAAYSSKADRERRLSEEISRGHHALKSEDFIDKARRLMSRDEEESAEPHGQRVARTFALADLSVNVSNPDNAKIEIRRFVELLFGHPFHTPTIDEQGMFLARSSAVRSASPGRQVGAALCQPNGTVVSLGTNEVPKAGGGLYWTGEDLDQRDFRRGHDSSDKMKRILLGDILKHLADAKWLKDEYSKQVPSALVSKCLDGPKPLMKRAEFTRTIDFVRAVHAEMAALLAAARQGVSTQGCILYTTTFPCHDCAKHMVAAGVIRVVYVEPYPKSLVQELCSDSMTFDDERGTTKVQVNQFVGVTPVRYLDLFAVGERKRKSEQGDTVSWDPSTAEPYQPGGIFSTDWVWSKEAAESKAFIDLLISKGLVRHEQRQGGSDDV